MSWSWTYQTRRVDPRLDDFLLLVGRALYLASEYEQKCKYLLAINELIDFTEAGNAAHDFKTKIPNNLGQTLTRLEKSLLQIPSDVQTLLNDGREARNFIAHECTLIGPLSSNIGGIEDARAKLKEKIELLIKADIAASNIIHEMTEHNLISPIFVEDYRKFFTEWLKC